jgi:uroporphyrinogen-III synthase
MDAVLQGFTVGITADRRWDEQASLFERRGATVVHAPTIRTIPLGSDVALRTATDLVIAGRPAVLVANTGLGIRSWFGAAESWGLGASLLAALANSQIFARGPKASGAIHAAGLDVAGRAASERLAEAVDMALGVLSPGDVVAVQVDGSGGSVQFERLRDFGARVIEIPVYEWKLPEDRRPAVRLAEAVIAGRVHAVTFTTGPAVRNWFAILAECDLDIPLRAVLASGDVLVGCVGPVCAESLLAEGISAGHVVMPDAWRLGPLVRSVADELVARTVGVDMLGARLCLAGTHATIDGEPVTLTDIESRVLAVLAMRPNYVHTKRDLLQAVWGSQDGDPHAVEVAVGRLRRRLGASGAAIASIHRRGYMLRT